MASHTFPLPTEGVQENLIPRSGIVGQPLHKVNLPLVPPKAIGRQERPPAQRTRDGDIKALSLTRVTRIPEGPRACIQGVLGVQVQGSRQELTASPPSEKDAYLSFRRCR